MAADASAYAALGVEPGADAVTIERAYKRLIKQYHPDREGGNAERAAEINRAYRELRAGRMPEALELAHEAEFVRGERAGRVRVALGLAGAVLALVFVTNPLIGLLGHCPRRPHHRRRRGLSTVRPAHLEAMDEPLNTAPIDDAIRDAVRLSRDWDELALADSSRDCHRQLRAAPTLEQLDRCAAFDDAVIQLQDRDPLRDRGPFSELEVTGRLMSGATLLSNDYLAIDSRLDRVRLHVELALAPPPPPPAAILPPHPSPAAEGMEASD